TIRHGDQVTIIPKIAAQDITLTWATLTVDDNFPRPVRDGSQSSCPGLHYNPRYWKEPRKFMPERFLGDWPRHAFIPFSQGMSCPPQHCNHCITHEHSAGPRACLGRRCEASIAV
ncbi:hypothetical protein BJV77DRAFT_939850, partial [Russula vinacea]